MKKIGPILVSVAAALLLTTTSAFSVTGFSEVNNELFDKAHLKNITEESILHYIYKKDHFIDGARKDTIDVIITNIRNTGRKDTHIEFFTGPHNRPYLDRDNQQGNSVFVFFLEFDVRELNRLTGGDWHYFQRKIRWALAKGATKKEVDINYNGKKVKGIQYIIQPFINDPKNARYTLYANKYYLFTLSEEIPGEIYQIRTIVPDGKKWQDGDKVLSEETITFSGVDKLIDLK